MEAIINFFTGTLNTVAWLYIFLPCTIVGGLYLTIRNRGIQFTRFGYAMKNTVGKMFQKQEAGAGAVTPLQAVTTALAATVGTGNIVGTSQAIALGGYGAVFWLWLAALLGMIIKYSEVTLSIKYRERDAKGDWVGGPMYYTRDGLGSMCQHRAGSVRADHDHRLEFLQQKMHPVSVQRKRHQTVSLFLEAVDPPSARCRSSISVPSGWSPTRCMP